MCPRLVDGKRVQYPQLTQTKSTSSDSDGRPHVTIRWFPRHTCLFFHLLSLISYTTRHWSKASSLVTVFFFEAEDGIRDFCVTGVQTCALPISPHRWTPCCRNARRCRNTAWPARSAGTAR